jgi:uncharacterized membrane protein HdeD (DUF308 family)
MEIEKTAVLCGVLLIITGVAASLLSGQPTAVIPAPFGLLLAISGIIALKKPDLKKHTMHFAAVLALIGLLLTITGVIAGIQYLFGVEIQRPLAAAVQSAMFLICAVFTYFAVRSFVQARSERLR